MYRIVILLILSSYFTHAQIVFYNVENLFDTKNDSLTLDGEFTATGRKNWTNYKLSKKIKNIAKTLKAIGKFNAPKIIGLCEIENRKILERLIKNPALKKYNYQIIHKDSPDRRGIDVALLYQKKELKTLYKQWIPIYFKDKRIKTRDILYVKGLLYQKDTVHFFVNHFPSRWGGKKKSEHKRIKVASVLRYKVDSIVKRVPNANILIMGDLNDEPNDKSILEVLKAHPLDKYNRSFLVNMSSTMKWKGTYKYRNYWSKIDHIIVSTTFLKFIKGKRAWIFNPNFLLEKDNKYLGKKPKRTFIGPKYNGGFSDHLPIYIQLKLHSQNK